MRKKMFNFFIFKWCLLKRINCIFITQSYILLIILFVILHLYIYLTYNLLKFLSTPFFLHIYLLKVGCVYVPTVSGFLTE